MTGALLSAMYGRVAAARRHSFEQHPERRRRLSRPVISIGNLVVGGSGKTPVTAHVASLLARAGERPAVLSRGYGRRLREPGVVIVTDGVRFMADVDRAGDEPLMLARALHGDHGNGVGVFVATDRHAAGKVAETTYGATVHLLDDGFQHLTLARDIDLVVVSPRDLEGERVLPAGRLREPVETIRRADALLVAGGTVAEARALAAKWGVTQAFTVMRTPAVPRMVEPYGAAPRVPLSAPVVVVAGIARPERFVDDLAASGWTVAETLIFRDHHRFDRRDLARIAERVRQTGAQLVLTTEKDLMRLMPWRPLAFPLAWVPLAVAIEPADDFQRWLRVRLEAALLGGTSAASATAAVGGH